MATSGHAPCGTVARARLSARPRRKFSLAYAPISAQILTMFKLFKRTPKPTGQAALGQGKGGQPRPELASYIVGDLMGCASLLEGILARIDAHIGNSGATNPQLVFVGNYLHAGGQGLATLDRLMDLTQEFPNNVTCLCGAQERLLLDSLDAPAVRLQRWLRAGAPRFLQELKLDPNLPPDDLVTHLSDVLGEARITWLANLPLFWKSGSLAATHAGADPHHPLDQQSGRNLIWGHPEFAYRLRGDGLWIAHGHNAVESATQAEGRIALNTRPDETGRLSAVAILPDGSTTELHT
ncbi:hypothetical protein HKCCA1058_11135 [Rhodobacterales bacterium HKCCA1058]|nr:hypothetical protein [Rhodobacterales bacterium HKCCA1058]